MNPHLFFFSYTLVSYHLYFPQEHTQFKSIKIKSLIVYEVSIY